MAVMSAMDKTTVETTVMKPSVEEVSSRNGCKTDH